MVDESMTTTPRCPPQLQLQLGFRSVNRVELDFDAPCCRTMSSGSLQVTLVEGKNLKDKDWFSKQDPYCILTLLGPGNARGETWRSRTHNNGGKTPHWNQSTMFTMRDGFNILLIECKDSDIGTDDLIGKAAANLDAIFKAPGQQVDQWVNLVSNHGKHRGEIRILLKYTPVGGVAVPQNAVGGWGLPPPPVAGGGGAAAPPPAYHQPAPAPAPAPAAGQTCSSCQRVNPSGSKFCTGCGKATSAPPPAAIGSSCTRCSASLPPGAKFCTLCGAPVAAPGNTCKCGSPLSPSDKFCTSCGSPCSAGGSSAPPPPASAAAPPPAYGAPPPAAAAPPPAYGAPPPAAAAPPPYSPPPGNVAPFPYSGSGASAPPPYSAPGGSSAATAPPPYSGAGTSAPPPYSGSGASAPPPAYSGGGPPPPAYDAASLPPGWQEFKDSSGKSYFFHKATNKTQWERPT